MKVLGAHQRAHTSEFTKSHARISLQSRHEFLRPPSPPRIIPKAQPELEDEVLSKLQEIMSLVDRKPESDHIRICDNFPAGADASAATPCMTTTSYLLALFRYSTCLGTFSLPQHLIIRPYYQY